MRKEVLSVSWILFSLISTSGYALGLQHATSKHQNDKFQAEPLPNGYLRGEVGYSFSRKGNFQVSRNDWTSTNEGYNDDFGNSAQFGLGVGMYASSLVSIGISAQIRPDFNYSKRQTIQGSLPLENPNLFFPALNGWTRKFDLENKSYMVDVFLNRAGKASKYTYDVNGIKIIPFIGGSFGLSVNKVSDFRTETNSQDNAGSFIFNRSRVIMTPKSFKNFGWQFQIGTDVPVRESVLLSLAYRYFDGGRLGSNTYAIDLLRDEGIERTYLYAVSPWKARLKANELVASITVLV